MQSAVSLIEQIENCKKKCNFSYFPASIAREEVFDSPKYTIQQIATHRIEVLHTEKIDGQERRYFFEVKNAAG